MIMTGEDGALLSLEEVVSLKRALRKWAMSNFGADAEEVVLE